LIIMNIDWCEGVNAMRGWTNRVMAALLIVAVLCVPTVAQAQSTKGIGGGLIAGGAGLMAAAFNYGKGQCASGYTTHTFEWNDPTMGSRTETRCVAISGTGNSDVYEPDVRITFKRPGLLWAGVGAVGAGVVLLLLPPKAQQVVPSVAVTPTGATVSKRITF
jgi:hypothetical protein